MPALPRASGRSDPRVPCRVRGDEGLGRPAGVAREGAYVLADRPPVLAAGEDLEPAAPSGEKAVNGDRVLLVRAYVGAVGEGEGVYPVTRGPLRVVGVAEAADGQEVVPARPVLLLQRAPDLRPAQLHPDQVPPGGLHGEEFAVGDGARVYIRPQAAGRDQREVRPGEVALPVRDKVAQGALAAGGGG